MIKRNKTIYDRAEDLVLSFNALVNRDDYDFVKKKKIIKVILISQIFIFSFFILKLIFTF